MEADPKNIVTFKMPVSGKGESSNNEASRSFLLEAEQNNERLIEMKLDQDDFLHAVSHDLRGPVNNIEGIAELLKESLEKEDIEEIKTLMGYMQHSVKSMGALILEVTEERKATLNKHVTFENVNLFAIMERVNTLLANHPGYATATITTNFAVKEIAFNRKDLLSIFYSICHNALQHNMGKTSGCVLEISSFKNGDLTVVSFKDNGPGISEQEIEKISAKKIPVSFGPNKTGLSLRILSKLLENKQGKMEITNNADQGTEVALFFNSQQK